MRTATILRFVSMALFSISAGACNQPKDSARAGSSNSAIAAPAPAQGGVADPVRFIKAAYGLDPRSPDKPSDIDLRDAQRPEYSPRLRDLFALEDREGNPDEVGRLDMNIYTGAQDDEIKDMKITSSDVDDARPPRRIVTATFVNIDRPTVMHFYFEKIGDRWFLDDISSDAELKPDGAPGWTLSTVLKYGWV